MPTETQHARPSAQILCWKCHSLVRLTTIRPIRFKEGVTDTVYECQKCGTVTTRTFPREQQSPPRGLQNSTASNYRRGNVTAAEFVVRDLDGKASAGKAVAEAVLGTPCRICGAPTRLEALEPHPSYGTICDVCTFACTVCGGTDTRIVDRWTGRELPIKRKPDGTTGTL